MTLEGNALVAQSGGPTAVINSSLYGVIEEARRYRFINHLYGALFGIEGVLKKRIINLNREPNEVIQGLKRTPGAALGGCRYRVQDRDVTTILEAFDSLNVRYFFYIGGNDSMDTARRIDEAAQEQGYDMRVIGVPKTVDNDLPETHHCPGFGSCAKYVAASVREAGIHAASMLTSEPITIFQTVGRNTGWLPGASALARVGNSDAPNLIYFPEIPFDIDGFLGDVESVCQRLGGAFIVVGEGLKDASGEYIDVQQEAVATDDFGHPMLGGVGALLKNAIETHLGVKTRNIKLDICQQAAMHFASARDVSDAINVGVAAVKAAVEGRTGFMVTLLAEEEFTGLAELGRVANVERGVPRRWINRTGTFVTQCFLEYIRPLIRGEAEVRIQDGLPAYFGLKKSLVPWPGRRGGSAKQPWRKENGDGIPS